MFEHSSPTLRSRSPCASWAPPLHRGLVRGSFPAPHHHDPNEMLPNFSNLGHGGVSQSTCSCFIVENISYQCCYLQGHFAREDSWQIRGCITAASWQERALLTPRSPLWRCLCVLGIRTITSCKLAESIPLSWISCFLAPSRHAR